MLRICFWDFLFGDSTGTMYLLVKYFIYDGFCSFIILTLSIENQIFEQLEQLILGPSPTLLLHLEEQLYDLICNSSAKHYSEVTMEYEYLISD